MSFRACTGAALILMAATPLATGFQAAEPKFRVSVNLVQVDAVVTDSQGHPVGNLRPEDFQVSEDGKPQKITRFSWIEVEPPERPANAAIADPARSPRKDDVRRSIVLMIDDLGPFAEHDVLPVMTAARQFVAEQMAPGDLVSVTASRGGMGFYAQFTSDKRQLYAAIDHLAQRPGFGLWTVPTPEMLDDDGNVVPIPLKPGEPPYDFRGGDPPNPIGYLMWAIQGLQNAPGRKAVVLFSHSFAAPRSLVGMANRAGVVIYVIDPHGMDPGGRITPGSAPYRLLARDTGGLYIRSSPGANLTADLGKVLADMSGYYLIGYQAGRSEEELAQGARVHHEIQVKVNRPGLTVRARNGFLGAPDATAAGRGPQTSEEYLQQALYSPFNAGKIRLRVQPAYGASARDPQTRLRSPILRARLEADGRDLQFNDTPEGKRKLVYTVLVAVFNQDGTPALSRGQTFSVTLTPEEAARIAASGLQAAIEVKLSKAGPYQIRAAVRDEGSGAMGSAYAFLDVPDFNAPRMVLSSIALSAPDDAQVRAAGWNQYFAGSSVQFECGVFGFKNAPEAAGGPRVEMEIRLFRNGRDTPVFDSRRLPVPGATLADNYLAGRVRIGSDLEPGQYALQLVAYDRLASPRKQVAAGWVNLTVTDPAGK